MTNSPVITALFIFIAFIMALGSVMRSGKIVRHKEIPAKAKPDIIGWEIISVVLAVGVGACAYTQRINGVMIFVALSVIATVIIPLLQHKAIVRYSEPKVAEDEPKA